MTKYNTFEYRGASAKSGLQSRLYLGRQQIYGRAMLYEYVERAVCLGSAVEYVYIIEVEIQEHIKVCVRVWGMRIAQKKLQICLMIYFGFKRWWHRFNI